MVRRVLIGNGVPSIAMTMTMTMTTKTTILITRDWKPDLSFIVLVS